MGNSGYTILGWIVWRVGVRVAKRKLAQNRVKLGVVAMAALALAVGAAAAAQSGTDD
jgi:hypothetical protein